MTSYLTGTDRSESLLLAISGGTSQDIAYSPFGSAPSTSIDEVPLPGFNGERRDPLCGFTHLGNGYRAYNPTLMRFTCPDNESPFGVGGINAYTYCGSDPINKVDPSGKQFGEFLLGMFAFTRRVTTEAVGAASTKAATETGRVVTAAATTTSVAMNTGAAFAENPKAQKALGTLGALAGIWGTFSVIGDVYHTMRFAAHEVHRAEQVAVQRIRMFDDEVATHFGGRRRDATLHRQGSIRRRNLPDPSVVDDDAVRDSSSLPRNSAVSSQSSSETSTQGTRSRSTRNATTQTETSRNESNESPRRTTSQSGAAQFDEGSGPQPWLSNIRRLSSSGEIFV
ncbi:RHS repeat-associated core domain-containing protein [Paraburkholderia humisilvae]|uniref:RHS repeat-associated core domain-containing protein n=1 Tax=Paraburkholderia humisilvae TaxID=627669 RepID=A0A6J5DE37_9BURK|nr:RHS repeat-associated core domain-containing protein [Paraburkholderia humisilvae]CAB3751704.1 hypothetical protein LMG29542_01531 [Paraburkholderia humisilvae]